MVKMNMVLVAEQLLLSHQFFFGINGGVQQKEERKKEIPYK